ncbi:uncharacterized protein LOC107367396 isoform X3 [Tetranychus urticae]|uniref:uncharacterized protein LOC107367396 isoform X3 n=1 Tax=Tetranychus urticae TaxID=32264 RepID=UPI00077BC7CD|nr:uncharacterized protein LOC107367396 isoform X3 [Tetranychus urticae]
MIQSVAKHNSVSPSSSVLLNALIFFMSVSMVHSNSPYKSVETLSPLELSYNSNLEQSEVPPKRYSEFLGGPGKRVSEFLGGPGKRAPTYGYVSEQGKQTRPQSVYYLAKKLSEILRASNGPNLGPYRPGGSEFLGGPGRR